MRNLLSALCLTLFCSPVLAADAKMAERGVVEEYKHRIAVKIKRFIILPTNLQGNPEVEFDVVLLPSGETLGVLIRSSSGQPDWDKAVERAILIAQPLPLPPDPAMFQHFRRLSLSFKPRE